MLDKALIKEYNEQRKRGAEHLLCHAPFTSLNFEQNGNVTACCFNRFHILGNVSKDSIQDTWYGEPANKLRNYIRGNNLNGGCQACSQLLEAKNFKGSKAIYYDEYARSSLKEKGLKALQNIGLPYKGMPRVFEFELSNKCNLECTMCNGYFSSSIRANREKLPPMKMMYDNNFVEQLDYFIPHLTDMKFLGGEPFLIDIYYKIWEKVAKLNPKLKMHITTNGTIYNGKVRALLDKLNCGIILSIDSLNKTTYEKIRKNSTFEKVEANMWKLIEYTRSKNTYFSFSVCPIKDNWQDLPDMLRFANKNDINIHFNTVWTPEDLSLRYLTDEKFNEIINFWESQEYDTSYPRANWNINKFKEVLHTVKFWREERVADLPPKIKHVVAKSKPKVLAGDHKQLSVAEIFTQHTGSPETTSLMNEVRNTMEDKAFIIEYLNALTAFVQEETVTENKEVLVNNVSLILENIDNINNYKYMSDELIKSDFLFQIDYLITYKSEVVISNILSRYSEL